MANQELIQLWMNDEKRRAFLANYKEWGEWLDVAELGLTYYKYELPKGGRIIAMEYQRELAYPAEGDDRLRTVVVYYLWEDYDRFVPNPVGEYYLADRLKHLKMEMQKELRSQTDA